MFWWVKTALYISKPDGWVATSIQLTPWGSSAYSCSNVLNLLTCYHDSTQHAGQAVLYLMLRSYCFHQRGISNFLHQSIPVNQQTVVLWLYYYAASNSNTCSPLLLPGRAVRLGIRPLSHLCSFWKKRFTFLDHMQRYLWFSFWKSPVHWIFSVRLWTVLSHSRCLLCTFSMRKLLACMHSKSGLKPHSKTKFEHELGFYILKDANT